MYFFWHQKVHSKTFLAPDSGNILCKNKSLSGSDPANYPANFMRLTAA